jgi:hypothetical protein
MYSLGATRYDVIVATFYVFEVLMSASMKRSSKSKKQHNHGSASTVPHHLAYRGNPFPPVLDTEMSWTFEDSLTSTAGALQGAIYDINSPRDPADSGGLFRESRYFDSLVGPVGGSAPYAFYRVLRTRIEVTFVNLSGNPVRCGVLPYASFNTGAASSDELSERPLGTTSIVGANSSGNSLWNFARSISISETEQVPGILVQTDDDYRGTASTAPTARSHVQLAVEMMGSLSGAVNYKIRLIHQVRLSGLIDVADSNLSRTKYKTARKPAPLPDSSPASHPGAPPCTCVDCRHGSPDANSH